MNRFLNKKFKPLDRKYGYLNSAKGSIEPDTQYGIEPYSNSIGEEDPNIKDDDCLGSTRQPELEDAADLEDFFE